MIINSKSTLLLSPVSGCYVMDDQCIFLVHCRVSGEKGKGIDHYRLS